MSPVKSNLLYKSIDWRLLTKFFIVFIIFLSILFSLSYLLLKEVSFKEIEGYLNEEDNYISNDISYTEESVNYYDNPNTLSVYSLYPQYIISSQGVILKKINEINGLFNEPSYIDLVTYTIPQTINLGKNQNIRITSNPIQKGGIAYGVIVVTYKTSQDIDIKQIDNILKQNINNIILRTSINKDSKIIIDTKDLTVSDPNISIQIISKDNKEIYSTEKAPLIINTKALAEESTLKKNLKIVKDKITNEDFLILSHTIFTKNNIPIATIIVGRSLSEIYAKLNNFLITILPFSILIPILVFIGYIALKKEMIIIEMKLKDEENKKILTEKALKSEEIIILQDELSLIHPLVIFNKKDSSLKIDENNVHIPYASNQYYLCKTLFSNKNKRWEQDELLEKMGDNDTNNSRKIYDAAIAINKKAGYKLIIYQDKTFRLNPTFSYNYKS